MPKIPTYNAQTTAQQKLSVRRLSAADFGGGLGIQELGGALHRRELTSDNAKAHKNISALRTELTTEFFDQANDAAGSPDFANDFATHIDKKIENLALEFNTSEGQNTFDAAADELKHSFSRKAIQFQIEATRENAINDFKDGLNSARNTLVTDPSQFEDILHFQEQHVDSLDIQDTAKKELFISTKRELALSALQGGVRLDPDLTEQEIIKGTWDEFIDADDKARILASLASAKASNKAEIRAAINDAKPRLLEGLDIPPAEASRIDLMLARSGDENLKKDWQILQIIQNQNAQLRELRPSDVQGYITSVLAPKINDTATQAEFELFDSANKLLNNMRSEIKQDPLAWAARAGAVVLNPLSEKGAYEQRSQIARQVADYYGVAEQPFTKDEATELAQRLSTATVTDQLIEIKRITEGLGDLAPFGFSQIGEDNGVFAQAGTLLTLSPTHIGTVQNILEGAKILREDKASAKLLGGESGAATVFRNRVKDTFASVPKMQKAVRSAVNALYVRLATQKGEIEFDSDIYEEAISLVLGGDGSDETGLVERNNVSFVLPPNVNEDKFDTALSKITKDQLIEFSEGKLAPTFADSSLVTPEQIADEGKFHSIGYGRYLVSMKDGGFLSGGGLNGLYVINLDLDAVNEIINNSKDSQPKDDVSVILKSIEDRRKQ